MLSSTIPGATHPGRRTHMSQALPIDIDSDGDLGNYLRGLKARDHELQEIDDDIDAPLAPPSTATCPPSPFAKNVLQRLQQLKFTVDREQDLSILDLPVPKTPQELRNYVFENPPPPLPWFVVGISRSQVFEIVGLFTEWLSATSDDNLSVWIWTVFVRLDREMEANEMAVIRGLGKKAAQLLNEVDQSNPARFTLNMVVVVVAYYYGQLDLLADISPDQLDMPADEGGEKGNEIMGETFEP
ncbi:hypothetical protein DIURU_004439 [Diutina rugosa]|uniref:Uncharacterized protein n=1 Tax=Diutina rugosa TaxID=5481 RepID=A0A642ULJ4_DIURU|nr:uncharacterized protein DIURU_004439 [Diutina rugosa]KAA8899058.1 hypothetical protein DIURU_004439 [Diutina rugosa]